MNSNALFYESGKRAVLLFHAFTSNSKDMLSLGRALERADYTVYAPVFSGHGTGNPDDLFDYGMKDWVQDGKDALAFLREKGYEEIAVFGLSLGGIVATTLLIEDDSLKGGGVFASPVVSGFDTRVPENFMEWYEAMKKQAGYSREEIAGQKTSAEVQLETILNGLSDHVSSLEPTYASLDKKIFIGQGDEDKMIDQQASVAFKEKLVQADVDFHWYKGAPHVLTTGRIGKDLQVDVLTFLSTLDWNGE